MKCSLDISNFLEEISSLSHSVVFLYFFAVIAEEGFLISSCYSLELCIQMFISFLFSFAFRFSSFHSCFSPCLRDLVLLVPCSQGPKAASKAYTGHPQVYSPKVLFSCTALGAEVGKAAWKGVSVDVEGAWLYSLGRVFVYVRLWLLLVQERARGLLEQSCSLRILGFFSFGHAVWHVGSKFPDQGSNPHPLHRQCRVLTTRPPGKFPEDLFLYLAFLVLFKVQLQG